MTIRTAKWDDGTPQSQNNVFSWQTVNWDGPIKRDRKRNRRGKVQRPQRERILGALRNL